jgi:hypothetical protein
MRAVILSEAKDLTTRSCITQNDFVILASNVEFLAPLAMTGVECWALDVEGWAFPLYLSTLICRCSAC